MGEVVPFRIEKSKYDARILRIFNKISKKVKYAKNADIGDYNDSMNELNFLDGYLSNLILKYKDGRTWKNEKVHKKYISLINDYEFDFKEDPYNRINIIYYELILTYLFDIYPLLYKVDKDTIRNVVSAFDDNFSYALETNSKVNRDKVKLLFNPLIQEIIKQDDDIYTSKNMSDILSLYEEGQPIPSIVSLYKESDEEDSLSLDKGIITIGRIRDFYMFQNDMYIKIMSNTDIPLDEHYNRYFDSFEYLNTIDTLDERSKLHFIALVNDIRAHNYNLDKELRFVAYLSDFYKYYEESIASFDIQTIKNLVNYRCINDCDMDEVDFVRKSMESSSGLKR